MTWARKVAPRRRRSMIQCRPSPRHSHVTADDRLSRSYRNGRCWCTKRSHCPCAGSASFLERRTAGSFPIRRRRARPPVSTLKARHYLEAASRVLLLRPLGRRRRCQSSWTTTGVQAGMRQLRVAGSRRSHASIPYGQGRAWGMP